MNTNVAWILKKHKELWAKAYKINPAIQPSGSNLNWDEYYKAVAEAQDFEKANVSIKGVQR